MSKDKKVERSAAKVPGATTLEAMVMRSATDDDVAAVYGGVALLSLIEEQAAKGQCVDDSGEIDLDAYSRLLDIVEKKQRIRIKSAQLIQKCRDEKRASTAQYVVAPNKWSEALEAHEVQ